MTVLDLRDPIRRRLAAPDRVVVSLAAGLVLLAIVDPDQWPMSLRFMLAALVGLLPFLLASVVFAATAKASGLDNQIARIFAGRRETSAVAAAAVFGAMSPFCSCGVVPIIAGFLKAGVPLGPVMAFWLASPLMDPEMLILMLPVFGPAFTAAKVAAAISIGMLGGAVALTLSRRGLLGGALRVEAAGCASRCGARRQIDVKPMAWRFWRETERRRVFGSTLWQTGPFLLKWLALAFFCESLMVAYLPADTIGRMLGDESLWAIPAAAVAGIPAYLNGYVAIPTVSGLIDLGMAPGAGLAFMLAGGVTSLPAAMAVFPLVRARVFAIYLAAGGSGAMAAGFAYSLA